MKIYESEFLQIQFERENQCVVQFWKKSPEDYSTLKKEFEAYTRLYLKHKPSNALWIQKNFQLPMDHEIHQWIEKNVNIPCVENGNKKVAFVVGMDVLVHLSVMSYFEEANSVIHPLHFATETEARQWLNGSENDIKAETDIKILFEGVDQEGNSIIKIKRPAGDITNTILSFGNLIEENNFIKANISKFSKLTMREKEVMILFAKGLRHQEVADKLFISVQTIKTHWKNIKTKLEIKSLVDVIKYVSAFEMK
ncbi:response regulator transcription factor [Christiangramia salexigens]|uniref:HTH luxR-type domain-containing protein n=1 Tax=Christiangramia salexigens TaxID=1913577 RepID=A0A1L3J7E7_9FLAO|nr:LuxR C-terminal-related transcriptional regulator [Christiangramia salexigens]APG61031.1 hypothetical protein LPB144_11715 [Christiangramia salexigens]